MKTGRYLVIFPALFLGVALPQAASSKAMLGADDPHSYRFICEYQQTDADEVFLGKEFIEATYVYGLPEGRIEWRDVSITRAEKLDDEYPKSGTALEFMSGFGYDRRDRFQSFSPGFFEGFPGTAAAVYAKNLVWDTHMLEQFATSYTSDLQLNVPYALPDASNSSVPLAGMGAFKNRKITLTWIGRSERNGQKCRLIRYEAFFNRFNVRLSGSSIDGLSHYWGLIWVATEDGALEHATLNEHVSIKVKSKARPDSRYRVLRVASLTKI